MAGLSTMSETAARSLAQEINDAGWPFKSEPIQAKHGHWQVRVIYRPGSPLARIFKIPNRRSWEDVRAMWLDERIA